MPYGDSRDRFAEALDIIKRAWTEPTFSHHGTHYRFDAVSVVPRPYQQPHPPIRMAASTSETYAMIGALGLPIFVSARTVAWSELGPAIGRYRDAYEAAGHAGRSASLSSRCRSISPRARPRRGRSAEQSLMSFYRYQAKLQAEFGGALGRGGHGARGEGRAAAGPSPTRRRGATICSSARRRQLSRSLARGATSSA